MVQIGHQDNRLAEIHGLAFFHRPDPAFSRNAKEKTHSTALGRIRDDISCRIEVWVQRLTVVAVYLVASGSKVILDSSSKLGW